MPVEAFNVHGLSIEFLKNHRCFHEEADEFLDFVGDAPLVAHNGYFDLAFVNSELTIAKRTVFARDRIIDTLMLARRKHPGQSNKLDDLCARYKIDNSKRTKHGALLDAELLAEVYIELVGGRQTTLSLVSNWRCCCCNSRCRSVAPFAARTPAAPHQRRRTRSACRVHRDARRRSGVEEIRGG